MATEKRLIDADAYIAEYQVAADTARKIGGTEMNMLADFYYEVIKEIKIRHTVDAVEVVRCIDCKHWQPIHEHIPHMECQIFCGAYEHGYPTNADDFCSYGERKDNG